MGKFYKTLLALASHYYLTTTEVDLVEPKLQTRFYALGVVYLVEGGSLWEP